jgi:hypothetical protein
MNGFQVTPTAEALADSQTLQINARLAQQGREHVAQSVQDEGVLLEQERLWLNDQIRNYGRDLPQSVADRLRDYREKVAKRGVKARAPETLAGRLSPGAVAIQHDAETNTLPKLANPAYLDVYSPAPPAGAGVIQVRGGSDPVPPEALGSREVTWRVPVPGRD